MASAYQKKRLSTILRIGEKPDASVNPPRSGLVEKLKEAEELLKLMTADKKESDKRLKKEEKIYKEKLKEAEAKLKKIEDKKNKSKELFEKQVVMVKNLESTLKKLK